MTCAKSDAVHAATGPHPHQAPQTVYSVCHQPPFQETSMSDAPLRALRAALAPLSADLHALVAASPAPVTRTLAVLYWLHVASTS